MAIAELGEAVRWLRKRRGWPQKQLAAAAKITKGMLSGYETGKTTPTLKSLAKILRALRADLCDLYCAVEIANGRPAEVHDLSEHFLLGQKGSRRPAARKPPAAPRPAGPFAGEPAGDAESEPQLPEDVERALTETLAGVHKLLRHAFRR